MTGVRAAISVAALLGLTTGPASAIEVLLGAADSLALDQPRITFGLTDESTTPGTVIGPTLQNLALLDTGANGVLLAQLSYIDGEDYGQPAFAADYDASGFIDLDEQLAQYAELGVAGTSLLNVHDTHALRITDSDGVERIVNPAVRAFGDDSLNIGSTVIMPLVAVDKIVIPAQGFDFTATDGTALMRLDTTNSFIVPEPSSLLLIGGLSMVFAGRRRR